MVTDFSGNYLLFYYKKRVITQGIPKNVRKFFSFSKVKKNNIALIGICMFPYTRKKIMYI